MKNILAFLLLFTFLFACKKSDIKPGVTDIVVANIPFEVRYIPCSDYTNPDCDGIPVVDATIRILKNEESSEEPQFIAESKTDQDGMLIFTRVPLGTYIAEVSTNEYGDTIVGTASFEGRTSAERVKFY